MMKRTARRQTLGSISSNSGTHHPTHGGEQKRKQKKGKGRVSMIPRVGRENGMPPSTPSRMIPKSVPNSTRRSSIGLERRQSLVPTSLPAKGDSRPVADKAFQQGCIKKLLKFLLERGYDHPVSQKGLTRPSGKDFSNIMTFLLRHVDPNFQDGTMKIEDEIAMNFRAMGYPFPVSKTALVAAGSPHTWPTLLAALNWLLERILLLEGTVQPSPNPSSFNSLEELESNTDKAFFQYLSSAYTAFLCGDEKTTEDLELALAERFENDDVIIEKEIERVTDKSSMILEQIRNLSPGETELQDLYKKRDGYSTDLEQFHDLIDQMDKHVKTLLNRQNDIRKELGIGSNRLESVNSLVERLSKSVKDQELLPEDVLSMQNEVKGIAEARDRIRTMIYTHQDSLKKKQTEAETFAVKINNLVTNYSVNMPEIIVEKDPTNPVPEEELTTPTTVHMSSTEDAPIQVHKSYMKRQKNHFRDKVDKAKDSFQGALDNLERSTESFCSALQKLRIVEDKLQKCNATQEAEKQSSDSKIQLRLSEVDALEQMVASLRDPLALEEQMAHYERQCASLETIKITDEKENARRVKEIVVELDQAVSAMKAFEHDCVSIVSSVEMYRHDSFSRTAE